MFQYYKTKLTLELLFDKENNLLAINYLNKKSIIDMRNLKIFIDIITIVKIERIITKKNK